MQAVSERILVFSLVKTYLSGYNSMGGGAVRMKRKKSRALRGSSMPATQLLVLGIALAVLIPGMLLGFLIVYSYLFPGWLYIILNILWYGLVMLLGYVVYKRIDLRLERYFLGDEAFFKAHPKEWKRELRRWNKVDSYRLIAQDLSPEELPALLQLGYDASDEDIAALGIALKARNETEDGLTKAPTMLLHKTPYDELYFREYPLRLKQRLARLRFRRKFIERMTSSSREPSLYEQRLLEIEKIIENKEKAN